MAKDRSRFVIDEGDVEVKEPASRKLDDAFLEEIGLQWTEPAEIATKTAEPVTVPDIHVTINVPKQDAPEPPTIYVSGPAQPRKIVKRVLYDDETGQVIGSTEEVED